jgi:C4-dicarboxylate-specific signal transduction histidine kinase
VIALVRSEMHDHGVAVRTGLGDALPPVVGDRIQRQQVLLNLMMNAIEAMSGNRYVPRELSITSTPADANAVVVSVAIRERLFDAFHTTKPHGMGMGLAISRSIVEAHGGRLWATANDPRGAVFQFTLPVA